MNALSAQCSASVAAAWHATMLPIGMQQQSCSDLVAVYELNDTKTFQKNMYIL